MKNIFKLSLVALLIGLPSLGFAAVEPHDPLVTLVGTKNSQTGKYEVAETNNLSTTSYVQGAYNVLGEAINTLNDYTYVAESAINKNAGDIEDLQGSVGANTTNITNLTNTVNALEIPDTGTGTVNVVKTWGGSSEEMDVTVDLSKTTTSGSGTQEEN